MAGLVANSNTPQSSNSSQDKGQISAELRDKFAAALVMAGGGYPDDSAYYRCYNSLHRLDYFNPNIASGLHIFMTRPALNLSGMNLVMDNSFLQACYTDEGCLLLASLCDPKRYIEIAVDEGAYQEESKIVQKNLQNHGLNVLGSTPFIPLVSNLSTGINGMKDPVLEKYEYDGDQAGHKTAEAMGMDESQSSGEFTINFIENADLGISMLNYLWMLYMDNTGKGLMNPTSYTVQNLEYDYMSSVYWFVTKQDMSIVLYGKLTGIYPLNTPLSSLVPSERGTSVDPKTSINYHFNHSEIMRPEIISDFNYQVDKAINDSATTYLENDPHVNNSVIQTWINDKFKLNPTNPASDMERNIKYERYMPTGKNGSKYTYNDGIFVPGPQNQWAGHPYVYNGKLVYKSIWKE